MHCIDKTRLSRQDFALQVLTSGLGNATLVRSACSLLRQLANSDAIKAEIVDAGGLELLCRAVDAHTTHAGKTVTLCCLELVST